jgi:YhcN/YlaJ family sporulation lipoprotein
MKKIWIFLSAIVLCLALAGCGTREADNTANNTNDNEAVDETLDDEANNEDQMDEVNLERADEAEKKVTDLDEVESATVIITENNAYVAAVLTKPENGEEIAEGSEELDQINTKISEQVKETNPDIENVYVSVNPDFIERMGDYADKIEAGEPIEGLGEEFTTLVERIFPDAK